MMIEKIFIPTVKRVENQITYQNLSPSLRERVVMVVQAWERPEYKYDCEYLVLPDTPEYHYSDYYCLPKTRKLIYEAGKDIKYSILDDDITFYKRNTKYFGEDSNMEKSRKVASHSEVEDMFSLFDEWLDEPEVTVCGCAQLQNPPFPTLYANNSSLTSTYWINGSDFKDLLPTLDLTSVRMGEDVCFLLSLLVNGFGNRVSNEYVIANQSVASKTFGSVLWDSQRIEQTEKDHKILAKMFPGIYNIVYQAGGGNTRQEGGYRNQGKSSIKWSKAYKYFDNTLENFFNN